MDGSSGQCLQRGAHSRVDFDRLVHLLLQRAHLAAHVHLKLTPHVHPKSDLKPDNVGFNFEGRVKLFDFGLAKELDPLQKTADGTCRKMYLYLAI